MSLIKSSLNYNLSHFYSLSNKQTYVHSILQLPNVPKYAEIGFIPTLCLQSTNIKLVMI